MAHKKGVGSLKNDRESETNVRKAFAGENKGW